MASRRSFFAFAFVLSISSRIFLGFSQDVHDLGSLGLQGTDSIVGLQGLMPGCVQKILPCQKYIKSPGNPPPECCSPLKEVLAGDLVCLCSFFNNAALLKAMNATRSEALLLTKACGSGLDESACNAKASSPASSPIGSSDATPAITSNGSSPSNHSHSHASRNNPSYGMGYGLAATSSFVALLLSTF